MANPIGGSLLDLFCDMLISSDAESDSRQGKVRGMGSGDGQTGEPNRKIAKRGDGQTGEPNRKIAKRGEGANWILQQSY